MIQQNEVITLLLSIGGFIFIIINWPTLKTVSNWEWLFISYCIFFSSRIFTVLEGFILRDTLNLLEHAGYALGAFFLTLWCFKFAKVQKFKK